jgi:hypothetical protein
MLIGTTELKFDKRNNSNVYVVGATGTGKTRLYIHTNVGQEKEKNIIVIESMKKETYYFTHQMKVEQGYQVLRLDLLSPYFHERLQELLSCHPQQKFILYIHVDIVGSTYEERGERVQNMLRIFLEQSSIQAMQVYLDEYDMYPIPHLAKVLCVTRGYQMEISIVVKKYHTQLQQIHGKDVANQVLTNCDRKLFFGTNSMQDAEYFSRISGYDQMELFFLQNEILVMGAYHIPQKIPIQQVDCKY